MFPLLPIHIQDIILKYLFDNVNKNYYICINELKYNINNYNDNIININKYSTFNKYWFSIYKINNNNNNNNNFSNKFMIKNKHNNICSFCKNITQNSILLNNGSLYHIFPMFYNFKNFTKDTKKIMKKFYKKNNYKQNIYTHNCKYFTICCGCYYGYSKKNIKFYI